jgi:polyisoprenoid-binding protein YceI
MNLRLLLPALLLVSTPAFATDYTMRAGTLKFAGEQQGERFEGRFDRFTPAVRIDPAAPASGSIDVSIDLGSAGTLNAERDEALKGADFFAIDRFPKARFVTTAMRKVDATHYEADAKLTIRDKTVALKFPFTFEPLPDGGARLKAQVTLDRLAFGLGTGDWEDAGMIAHPVEVIVDVSLVAKQ